MCFKSTLIITYFIYEKQPNKNSITLIWPFNVTKVKLYKVNWNAIYDLLYVFHTYFDHTCTVYEMQSVESYPTLITFKGHLRSSVLMETKRLYNFVYVFHRNIGHSITVSEILAQTDHLRPNLDLSDLENYL